MLLEELVKIVEFMVGAFVHMWPYLLITIPLAVTVKLSGAAKYINRAFQARPVVAIPGGLAFWIPKPIYSLHWERNGESMFGGRSHPAQILAQLKRRGVSSVVLAAPTPLPEDGSIGHPIADQWLRTGAVKLRPGLEARSSGPGQIWVLLDLQQD